MTDLYLLLIVGGLASVNGLTIYIAWRVSRQRPPESPRLDSEELSRGIAEIIDSNAATRHHVSAVADSIANDIQNRKLSQRASEGILRKIARAIGINTDDL